jgi:hypothetical protein
MKDIGKASPMAIELNASPGKQSKAARVRNTRPSFTSLDRSKVRGIGSLVMVELDRTTSDFSHLIGKKIVIDGRMETCFSVEGLHHPAPFKRGEQVSLVIRRDPGAGPFKRMKRKLG